MARRENIDRILQKWPYDPETINVRISNGSDNRPVLQMRIDLGLLQLEMEGRPDGERPHGAESYLDHLLGEVLHYGDDYEMNEESADEVDREFIQYYHRRICWLKLQEYGKAVADADHTLSLMDFCTEYAGDNQWASSHEQYRPFVLFHRTQAAALHALEEDGPDSGVQELNSGLRKLKELFEEHGDESEENELMQRLEEFRESLREQYSVGRTLQEQLADAVASEQYELAAKLRDEIDRRRLDSH